MLPFPSISICPMHTYKSAISPVISSIPISHPRRREHSYISFIYNTLFMMVYLLFLPSPLLRWRPSTFWLTTHVNSLSSQSLTNIMWVAVGVALVMSVVLHLLGLAALCACSSHLPGPECINSEGEFREWLNSIFSLPLRICSYSNN